MSFVDEYRVRIHGFINKKTPTGRDRLPRTSQFLADKKKNRPNPESFNWKEEYRDMGKSKQEAKDLVAEFDGTLQHLLAEVKPLSQDLRKAEQVLRDVKRPHNDREKIRKRARKTLDSLAGINLNQSLTRPLFDNLIATKVVLTQYPGTPAAQQYPVMDLDGPIAAAAALLAKMDSYPTTPTLLCTVVDIQLLKFHLENIRSASNMDTYARVQAARGLVRVLRPQVDQLNLSIANTKRFKYYWGSYSRATVTSEKSESLTLSSITSEPTMQAVPTHNFVEKTSIETLQKEISDNNKALRSDERQRIKRLNGKKIKPTKE
ncbi:hypothetical protein BGZ83_004328, partial [Gryganskiella cystojenkinii]